ncbi:unnamed protein product [Linum tenue]|uniref:Subtilisin-like protease fibronectin type-III domain-containing protein n=1 Tax=Linum tenue TaxID=586396 RepID=A0AAV0RYY7_9ROSI|nr:unnamed protein product [Linum tenue]
MGSLNPGLVYETDVTHHLLFMCYYGYDTNTVRWISKVARSSNFYCSQHSQSDLISNLNFPSISVGLTGANRTRTVPRVLTNVAGNGNWTYKAVLEFGGAGPVSHVRVKVFPRKLTFTENGQRRSYKIKFSSKEDYLMNQEFVYGWITWTNPHFKVRSPFVVRMN